MSKTTKIFVYSNEKLQCDSVWQTLLLFYLNEDVDKSRLCRSVTTDKNAAKKTALELDEGISWYEITSTILQDLN